MQYERLVVLIMALFGVVIGTYVSFKSGSFGYIFAFASLPFAILLVGQARLLYMFVLIAFNSGLRIPFLPGQLELFHVLALGLGGLLFLGRIINKEPNEYTAMLRYAIIGFALILILTMGIRGTGFKMLGDSKWGGVRYLTIFIALFMLFHSCSIKLTTKQWIIAVVGMQIAAYLPFLAELVFLQSKGTITGHYYFSNSKGLPGTSSGPLHRASTVAFSKEVQPLQARSYWRLCSAPLRGKGEFCTSSVALLRLPWSGSLVTA